MSHMSHLPRHACVPSSRLLRAAAIFSIPVPTRAAARERREQLASAALRVRELLGPRHTPRAGLMLIQGPSGSGKSTLLAAAQRELRTRRVRVATLPTASALPARPLTDLSPVPLTRWLRTLASCGLAEAALLTRTPRQLSAGQAWRLTLALALSRVMCCVVRRGACHTGRRARPRTPLRALIIDELGSGLDSITARGISRTLRRTAHNDKGLLILCATAAPAALRTALAPDHEIELTP
jgi:energy-coupling factor transporter ATP-binding protein EcfA2